MKTRAFTLIEILLAVGLMIIAAGAVAVLDRSVLVRNDVMTSADMITNSLRRAQLLSQSGKGDSSWGVLVNSSEVVVFKGDSYAGREVVYDERYDLSNSVSTYGISETVFSTYDGIPSVTGSVTVYSDFNSSQTITINEMGIVSQ